MGIERMPNGRKLETRQELENCPQCRGTGTVKDNQGMQQTCPHCQGRGKLRSASR
jgi:DnaJ-class molecular chaperone